MQNTNRASGVGYNLATSVHADTEKSSIAVFAFQNPGGSALTTLIPSISGYTVDLPSNSLTLQGSFGSGQGSVTLDDDSLTVNSWSNSTITTVLPSASTGKLQVYSPLSLKSNKFPYTEPNSWIGTWAGSVSSSCGYYSGPLTITISSTGGDGLQFALSGGFPGYAGTWSGNIAYSSDNSVVFTLSGNTMSAVESNSCQDGTYHRQ
jgi:hypothetical protein